MERDVRSEVRDVALAAKRASAGIALASGEQRNRALSAMAAALRERCDDILAANEHDVRAASQAGTSESLIDRLALSPSRIEDMAAALEDLAELDDPCGRVLEERTLYNGMRLRRVSVPLGVVAVVYEARPNVTADAAGICLKSGNACVLRGGSMAACSNEVIAAVLAKACEDAGMPKGSIGQIASTDRSATDELMQLHGIVDVLVPRGGAGLIRHCVECAKVPVIETGTGNCHVYVHGEADLSKALDIVVNAKCRRFGVCNAAETLLVDESVADAFLPAALSALGRFDVLVHGDERTCEIARALADGASDEMRPARCVPATQDDWEREYLGPEIAVRCVDGLAEAIDWVNRYSTKHSEAIVSENEAACERFQREVDAAAVYANASTAFTDGGQFGLGAEIGISTQKLHARGPFATDALTSYKYLLTGSGQVRA